MTATWMRHRVAAAPTWAHRLVTDVLHPQWFRGRPRYEREPALRLYRDIHATA